MSAATEPRLVTPGVIARELRAPLHRVLYVLTTRRHVRPKARAGAIRLYAEDAIAQVRHELAAIDARRCNQNGSGHDAT
ncbi:MAG: hypothetical protein KF724_06105 [Phycisphaeraceae bacterium]|nr:hypothetical protein [Phycisphaeraceae bacterium]